MTTALQRSPLVDRHGRVKRKLRVSLTDRCNFRCPYCLPESPRFMPRDALLSVDERLELIRVFVAEFGIRELRLTGGEPLLAKDLIETVCGLAALRPLGLQRLSLTTNGFLLALQAARLVDAGIDDINVSLDAVDPAVFSELSGGHDIAPVLDGLRAARESGLPTKLNAVVVADRSESQIRPLARFAAQTGLVLRFIEFMPLDSAAAWKPERVVTGARILDELAPFEPVAEPRPAGSPASYYRLDVLGSRIGIIPTISQPFCGDCDRLRLTASGQLLACLFSTSGPQLREALNGDDTAALRRAIRQAVHDKSPGYVASPGYTERPISMHGIGG